MEIITKDIVDNVRKQLNLSAKLFLFSNKKRVFTNKIGRCCAIFLITNNKVKIKIPIILYG
jgi:hypothetical protein